MPDSAVLLFEDETIIRLFPDLRRGWARSGVQATVGITGMNARRVLFGTINLKTGHRITVCYKRMSAAFFQDFLRQLRARYKGRPIWMLLDGASGHKTKPTRCLADTLNVVFVWLPKQCPELNAMDQLWRTLKQSVSANHQYESVDEHVQKAIDYVEGLSNKVAQQKAGILSNQFWLKRFVP